MLNVILLSSANHDAVQIRNVHLQMTAIKCVAKIGNVQKMEGAVATATALNRLYAKETKQLAITVIKIVNA